MFLFYLSGGLVQLLKPIVASPCILRTKHSALVSRATANNQLVGSGSILPRTCFDSRTGDDLPYLGTSKINGGVRENKQLPDLLL